MASGILDGREEAGRSCRHRPSGTEVIITFLACTDEKNYDHHHDMEDNQWQEKRWSRNSPGDGKCNRADGGDEAMKIREKW